MTRTFRRMERLARSRPAILRGAALASLAAAASAAVGEEFSWQVSAGGRQLEIGDTVDVDRTAVDGTFYFPPTDDEQGPYALAAFLSRSSYVGIAAHRDEEVTTIEFSSPISGSVTSVTETETEVWSISGRHVLPGSGWYAGAGYHAGDGDPPSSLLLQRDTEIEGYTVHFGKYLGNSTSVGLAWDSTDSTTELVASACFAYPLCLPIFGHAITAEEASIRLMHVGAVGGLAYSVFGDATSRRTDIELLPAVILEPHLPDVPPPSGIVPGGLIAAPPMPSVPSLGRSQRYSGAFELFPTARLGVRAGYARWDGDFQLDDAYELSIDWFFVRKLNARFALERTNRKTVRDEWSEADTLKLTLTGRF